MSNCVETASRPVRLRTWQPAPAKSEQVHCPTCGGLECLCRPRFFAGQLLTDEDLNRLDHYIVQKNRLHNRYLHGWGVVCGLEVVCHPCKEEVIVRQGYALSPCGDDIVVCKDVSVPVGSLIRECREAARRRMAECDPSGRLRELIGCDELTEDWVLSICYQETPSRGITALLGASGTPCCSRCACGGSPDCRCSCHEQQVPVPTTARQRTTLPQCEPTVMCEGYRFAVRPAPSKKTKVECQNGAMSKAFLTCLKRLSDVLPDPPRNLDNVTPQYWHKLRDGLSTFFAGEGGEACLWTAELCDITYDQKKDAAGNLAPLLRIMARYVRYCLCAALLPPCPEPAVDNCVPLAVVRVQLRDSRVKAVCNWRERRVAASMPALEYWLSVLPVDEILQRVLTQMCCALGESQLDSTSAVLSPQSCLSKIRTAILAGKWKAGEGTTDEAADLVKGLLLGFNEADSGLREEERNYPAQALLSSLLIKALGQTLT